MIFQLEVLRGDPNQSFKTPLGINLVDNKMKDYCKMIRYQMMNFFQESLVQLISPFLLFHL